MLSVFDQAEELMAEAQRNEFGDGYTFYPMIKRPNRRAVGDTSRLPFDFCAIWFSPSKMTDIDKNNIVDRRSHMRFTAHSQTTPMITVAICDLAYEPKQWDFVVRATNGNIYEITDLHPSGHSTIDLILSAVEGPYNLTD